MKISILGLGYIGLPTAALVASKKMEVIGVDVNSDVVDSINHLRISLVEPRLNELVQVAIESGYLRLGPNLVEQLG